MTEFEKYMSGGNGIKVGKIIPVTAPPKPAAKPKKYATPTTSTTTLLPKGGTKKVASSVPVKRTDKVSTVVLPKSAAEVTLQAGQSIPGTPYLQNTGFDPLGYALREEKNLKQQNKTKQQTNKQNQTSGGNGQNIIVIEKPTNKLANTVLATKIQPQEFSDKGYDHSGVVLTDNTPSEGLATKFSNRFSEEDFKRFDDIRALQENHNMSELEAMARYGMGMRPETTGLANAIK